MKSNTHQNQKLEEIEKEILLIFDDCCREGLTKEEIIQVFAPLGVTKEVVAKFHEDAKNSINARKGQADLNFNSKNARDKDKWKSKASSASRSFGKFMRSGKFLILLTVILVVGAAAYVVHPQGRVIRFQMMSLFRMGLIKILPLWKWTELYYSRCLIRNPFFEAQDLNVDDCNLCETLEDIERISNASQGTVIEQYIKREKPFIVTDAMIEWPIMKTDQLWFDNITELYSKQDKFFVCNLNTNLRGSYGDFTKILKKLYNPHTNQWFLHWENCQKDGAKSTRQFYRRPYFVSNSLDFTGSNWVLMSSDFKGRVYKKIEPSETLMMFYQIRGFNHIRLSPRETCRDHCPELSTTLNEGEILVIENLLWVMEYIPGEYGDNLGIISEVSWPAVE